jgi:thiamine biosynthesis protein ThiS
MSVAIKIILNGSEAEVKEGCLIDELIASLGLRPGRLAVELNRRIVRRAEWDSIRIGEGDRIEIVHFVGGGSGSCYCSH